MGILGVAVEPRFHIARRIGVRGRFGTAAGSNPAGAIARLESVLRWPSCRPEIDTGPMGRVAGTIMVNLTQPTNDFADSVGSATA